MQVLFCQPQTPQTTDDRFELEVAAAEELGIACAHLAIEAVVDDELDDALDGLELEDDEVVYRGWMLTQDDYTRLADALANRGIALVTPPEAYEAAHYLPSWIDALRGVTPETVWTEGVDIGEAWELAQRLGPPPWIVKDHVKSAKHAWDEACFVPASADRAAFTRICTALIDERGDAFERGLVVRRFVPLAHPPGMRGLADEHRLFFWEGRLVASAPYHDAPATSIVPATLHTLGRRIASPFISMDVARTVAGDWIVIEVGDGGVSTIPPLMDPRALYRRIANPNLKELA
jgi:hypothetical protein